jgi:hypothetical protein
MYHSSLTPSVTTRNISVRLFSSTVRSANGYMEYKVEISRKRCGFRTERPQHF